MVVVVVVPTVVVVDDGGGCYYCFCGRRGILFVVVSAGTFL